MKNISRSRVLLAGVIALTLSPVAPKAEALSPSSASQVSVELCARTSAAEAVVAPTKGSTVLTMEIQSDSPYFTGWKTITKRAANGNMSMESVVPTEYFDETTMMGGLWGFIETPEARYESYLPGYIENLDASQWVRVARGTPSYGESVIAGMFEVTDNSEWLTGLWSTLQEEAATQTDVEAEDGLCKYSVEDSEHSFVIAVDADGRLRSLALETLEGSYYRQMFSFEYSPVVIETPNEATWAPDSTLDAIQAREQEFTQHLEEPTQDFEEPTQDFEEPTQDFEEPTQDFD